MTENYSLKKPESTDKYNVDDFNENADVIDSKMKELTDELEGVKTSFQDGCNTIVAGCTSYGSTPTSNSPNDIVTSIGEIYENAYKEGAEDAEPTLQSKSATLNTSTTSVTLKPDSGYDGLSQATVSITTQEKTKSITSGSATVTPDSGKVLSKVTITGPTSYAGTTKDASAVSSDDTYTYLTVPANGYYSTASKIRTENSNLNNFDIAFLGATACLYASGYSTPPAFTNAETYQNAILINSFGSSTLSSKYSASGINTGAEVTITCDDSSFSYETIATGVYLLHNPNGASVSIAPNNYYINGLSACTLVKIN